MHNSFVSDRHSPPFSKTFRVEYIGPNSYDLYQWTFSNGLPATGNPAFVSLNSNLAATGSLVVYNIDPNAPSGYSTECQGSFTFPCGWRDVISRTKPGPIGSNTRKLDYVLIVNSSRVELQARGFKRNFWGIAWVSYSTRLVAITNCALMNANTCQPFGDNISADAVTTFINPNKNYSIPIYGVNLGVLATYRLIEGSGEINATIEN